MSFPQQCRGHERWVLVLEVRKSVVTQRLFNHIKRFNCMLLICNICFFIFVRLARCAGHAALVSPILSHVVIGIALLREKVRPNVCAILKRTPELVPLLSRFRPSPLSELSCGSSAWVSVLIRRVSCGHFAFRPRRARLATPDGRPISAVEDRGRKYHCSQRLCGHVLVFPGLLIHHMQIEG